MVHVHFLRGGGEGVSKKCTLFTLWKMVDIMDDPLYKNTINMNFLSLLVEIFVTFLFKFGPFKKSKIDAIF